MARKFSFELDFLFGIILVYVLFTKQSTMKSLTFASICIMLGALCNAQDCKQYYFFQNNKTVEMTIYNKKGDESGKNIYTISDVKTSGSETTATVNSEMFDKKGKSVVKATNEMKCNGGVMMMDMKMMIPQQTMEQYKTAEAKSEEVYLEYPAGMKEGDQLKDGSFKMTGQNGPIAFTLTLNITDRKVEGKESVTTTAGTWDCFRIASKTKLTIKMAINIPSNFETTEWYAPGFGIVKSETKGSGSTAITAIR